MDVLMYVPAHGPEAPHTQFCSTLVARYSTCSNHDGRRQHGLSCLHVCIERLLLVFCNMASQQTRYIFWISFLFFSISVCEYLSSCRGGKKHTLTENIYVICWPIDPWLTLLGQRGSVPLWRVCKHKCSQHGRCQWNGSGQG